MNEGILALLSAILTTIGVKALDKWLPSTDKKLDDAVQIRQELRKEVQELKSQVEKVETREDELRSKLHAAEEVAAKASLAKITLDEQVRVLQAQVARLQEEKISFEQERRELKEEITQCNLQINSLSRKIAMGGQ
jgi:peptidoglycan hydrolase CwlO-like protein